MDGNLMKKKRKSNNIYERYITLENLYKMWFIIKKTCKNKKDVYYFSLNLNTNLNNIYNALKNKTYIPSKYKIFIVYEPKPRVVMSQTIADKLVNHFIANYYLMPYLESSLIDSNVATRTNKGGKYAMDLLKKYFNKILINNPNEEIYCLKIDVSKYFYSIDHKILLEMLDKKLADKDVIGLIKIIISETNNDYVNEFIKKCNIKYNLDIPYYIDNKGLSIGAMSSQFLAIFYLNEIDHYIKEVLKCKYFIRYMDDFFILDTDKEKLKNCYKKIKDKIEKLNLKINKKSNIYRCSKGVSFIGYTYKVINNKLFISCKKDTIKRIEKKLVYLKENDIRKYKRSLGSYYGYFETVSKIEKEDLKVYVKELYKIVKNENKDYIIIIKDKKYYKTYSEDAMILWYLFNYKFFNNMVTFGNSAFDKVINKLKDLNINFKIISKIDELLVVSNENNSYLYYYDLSYKAYDLYKKEIKLISKLKVVLRDNPNRYKELYDYFDKLT